ncbi:MAG: hypothetical protein J6Y65_03105, partial [Eggerthellaceae bacterium]|nr:hypothetical protein [Eggerthellaceae bacterium]
MSKDFGEEVRKIIGKAKDERFLNRISNEEQTKMGLILPMFSAMGYDYSNPDEFSSEVPASINRKKDQRADYVIYN